MNDAEADGARRAALHARRGRVGRRGGREERRREVEDAVRPVGRTGQGHLLKVVNDATPERFREPKAGNRVVALKLKLKNLTAATYEDYVTNGARLVDARGKKHKAPALGALEPHLGQIKLARNGTATGWITFEVPDGVAISKLTYELNSGFGGQVATWKLR